MIAQVETKTYQADEYLELEIKSEERHSSDGRWHTKS
jgi:hypothetical protein